MNHTGVKQQTKLNCDVLIQGAGIGGLTLAIALERCGYRAVVVERASALAEVGAGIWMAPNPMQVFARLGLAERVADAGWSVERLRLQDARSGEIQTTEMSAVAERFGFETIALHRAALQRLLFEQLAAGSVRFGCTIEFMASVGDQVHAALSDGTSCAAALVVGADGFHSEVRRMAGLGGERRYSGSSSYRAIARGAQILSAQAEHEAYEIWAKGCRVGFSKINAADFYWYMTFDAPAGEASLPEERRSHAERLFRAHFPQWMGLLEGTRPEEILRTDISDLKPLARWSAGRIGVMGDAAHATTPNLGQGGAMAVEDALALAQAIQRFGLKEAAWERFEELRRKKVEWTVAASWSIGRVCHMGNPLLRLLRNVALRRTPESVTQRQMQRMYSVDAG